MLRCWQHPRTGALIAPHVLNGHKGSKVMRRKPPMRVTNSVSKDGRSLPGAGRAGVRGGRERGGSGLGGPGGRSVGGSRRGLPSRVGGGKADEWCGHGGRAGAMTSRRRAARGRALRNEAERPKDAQARAERAPPHLRCRSMPAGGAAGGCATTTAESGGPRACGGRLRVRRTVGRRRCRGLEMASKLQDRATSPRVQRAWRSKPERVASVRRA